MCIWIIIKNILWWDFFFQIYWQAWTTKTDVVTTCKNNISLSVSMFPFTCLHHFLESALSEERPGLNFLCQVDVCPHSNGQVFLCHSSFSADSFGDLFRFLTHSYSFFCPYCRNAVFFFLMLSSHRAFSSFLKARQMRSAHCVHIQTRRGVAFFFLYFFAIVYKLMYGWKRLGAKSLSGANSCLKVHCRGWCDRRLRVRQLKQRCNESKCKMFIF